MAFAAPVATFIDDFMVRFTGTLGLRVGAPAIAAADTGELTTGAPAANQNGISDRLGPGRGFWAAEDADRIRILINDGNQAAQGGAGQTSLVSFVTAGALASPRVVGGNLEVTFHNRGAQASGTIHILIVYRNPVRRGSFTRR